MLASPAYDVFNPRPSSSRIPDADLEPGPSGASAEPRSPALPKLNTAPRTQPSALGFLAAFSPPSSLSLPRSPLSCTDGASPTSSFCATPSPLSPLPLGQSIPSSASQPLSSSPAARFLSAFASPPTSAARPPTPPPDAEGQVVCGYTLGPVIGRGASSVVRAATSAGGATVAVKIVRCAPPALDAPVRAASARVAGFADARVSARKKAARARKALEHETSVWAGLSHEHLLPLFSTATAPLPAHSSAPFVPAGLVTFFVTLHCPAGSLYDLLAKAPEGGGVPHDDAGMLFRQVARGLRHMHERCGLVHGDVKLENVLIDDAGVCRLADFGMTRPIGGDASLLNSSSDESDDEENVPESSMAGVRARRQTSTTTTQLTAHASLRLSKPRGPAALRAQARKASLPALARPDAPDKKRKFPPGSLPYAAPELLAPPGAGRMARAPSGESDDGEKEDAGEGESPQPAQDVWALGVLLCALLTGKLPFADAFEPRLIVKIMHGVYDAPPGMSPAARAVLDGCLTHSAGARWPIAEVDDAAWAVGHDDAPLPQPTTIPQPTPATASRAPSRPAPLRTPSRAPSLPAHEDTSGFSPSTARAARPQISPTTSHRSPSSPRTPASASRGGSRSVSRAPRGRVMGGMRRRADGEGDEDEMEVDVYMREESVSRSATRPPRTPCDPLSPAGDERRGRKPFPPSASPFPSASSPGGEDALSALPERWAWRAPRTPSRPPTGAGSKSGAGVELAEVDARGEASRSASVDALVRAGGGVGGRSRSVGWR